VAKVFGGLKSV